MLRHSRNSTTARRGFTLVELLVATALSIMIMAILATAFSIALDTLSLLKSTASLSEDLRAADTIITRDLQAQHLEDDETGKIRISDSKVRDVSWLPQTTPAPIDRRGFFRVLQLSPARQNTSNPSPINTSTQTTVSRPPYQTVAPANYPYLNNANFNYAAPNPPPPASAPQYVLEGDDNGVTPSFRATDHSLHFTVKQRAELPERAFTTIVPPGAGISLYPSLIDQNSPNPNIYVSKWAEVAYFLAPTSQFTSTDNGLPAVKLYTLYRRQRVLLPVDVTMTSPQTLNAYPGLSLKPLALNQINTPSTITTVGNRLNIAALPVIGGTQAGTDILLTNVISFQVRLIQDPVPTLASDATNAAAFPAGFSYDTADGPGGKLQPRGIQIKLRVYEPKNRLTRQITIIQDL